jgi:hypothetical protein
MQEIVQMLHGKAPVSVNIGLSYPSNYEVVALPKTNDYLLWDARSLVWLTLNKF